MIVLWGSLVKLGGSVYLALVNYHSCNFVTLQAIVTTMHGGCMAATTVLCRSVVWRELGKRHLPMSLYKLKAFVTCTLTELNT